MKYKRNSGKGKGPGKPRKITRTEENSVARQLVADAQWLETLSQSKQYSFEWVHSVLLEILMQCMGKKEIVMGLSGQEQLVRIFKEKPALEIVGMIAKMNGHLFDVVKGNITKTLEGSVEHNHTIEMKPDANRTIEVFNILEQCGALQPPTEQISDSEVEQVYTA